MKFLLLFVVAVSSACLVKTESAKERYKKKLSQITTECGNEFDISNESMKKLMGGDFSDDTEKHQCFSKCTFDKANFFTENAINKEAIIKINSLFKPDIIEPLGKEIDKCKLDHPVIDSCNSAFLAIKCLTLERINSKYQ